MLKKKENIIIIVLLLVMIVALIGVSYSAFRFMGEGTKVNTITTGAITMTYEESSNIISLSGALPTTDTTGYKRLNPGEYFDFEVTTNIKGDSYINYEITAKALDGNTIDGKYIKLYLSKINDNGSETNVTPISYFVGSDSSRGIYGVPTYSEALESNDVTGRPSGEMSLTTGTIFAEGEETTNYRLRMWVSEDYNPQGDGGGKIFSVQVNVYGKNEAGPYPLLNTYSSYPDFHASEYEDNITSIVTKGDTKVPEDVITTFDLSEAGNNSVIGYLEDDGRGEGTYKLTIGADGKIIGNPDMSSYFSSLSKLETIDLSYLDTTNVTNMSRMFNECVSLKQIDLSQLNTSNVTYMNGMFRNCSSLTNLDLISLDTSNVTNMNSMFRDCSGLTDLDLSNFDTSNVTDMAEMFEGCSSLTELDLSNFDTSNVTDMSFMFAADQNLVAEDGGTYHIDLTDMSLKNIIFGDDFDTSNVTDMSGMFAGCSSLTELDLSNFNTSNVTDMGNSLILSLLAAAPGMFGGCTSLTKLDLRSFDTHNVTSMYAMFYNTPNLKEVLVSDKWVVNSGIRIDYMFDSSGVSAVTYE